MIDIMKPLNDYYSKNVYGIANWLKRYGGHEITANCRDIVALKFPAFQPHADIINITWKYQDRPGKYSVKTSMGFPTKPSRKDIIEVRELFAKAIREHDYDKADAFKAQQSAPLNLAPSIDLGIALELY